MDSRLQHIDSHASGRLTVYGWLHDRGRRELEVSVRVNGVPAGLAQLGLSSTDVTESDHSIEDPNVGFRLDLDHRMLPTGQHLVEVFVTPSGGMPLRVGSRTIPVIGSDLQPGAVTHGSPGSAPGLGTDTQLAGALDSPADGLPVLQNPLAALWMEYRDEVVRNYHEHFARITAGACIRPESVFAHQILPALYGGWNDEVLAVAASQRSSSAYRAGATLYGGTAFGDAFFRFVHSHGWQGYDVNKLHPLVPLTPEGYQKMFDRHLDAGAVFLAPYYMETLPVSGGGDALDRYLISPLNPRLASDRFHEALRQLMLR